MDDSVLLKCPNCGQAAQLPDSVVDEGHRCFSCGVPLEIADQVVAHRRVAARQGQVRGLIAGALLGAVGVALVGALGGRVGFGIAAAVAGSLLGATSGFFEGLMGGTELAILMWDGSWLTYYAKACIVIGGAGGFVIGLVTELTAEHSRLGILAPATAGGLCLGGLLGAAIGKVQGSRSGPNQRPA